LAALVRRVYEAERDGSPGVTIWGRGLAERDLLYVHDAITGLLLTIERCPDVDLLNIGTGRGHRVSHIAETVRDVVGFTGRLLYDTSKPEGPLKKTLDITRLRRLVGWEPPTSLDRGVELTLAWLDAHYQEVVHAD
jgi:GDP-L-fucose synthase